MRQVPQQLPSDTSELAAPFGSVVGYAATVATAPLMQQHDVRREVDEDNLFGSAPPSCGVFHDDHENYPDDSAPPPALLIKRSRGPSPPPAPLIQRSRSPSPPPAGNDFDGESGEFDESLDESDDPDLP